MERQVNRPVDTALDGRTDGRACACVWGTSSVCTLQYQCLWQTLMYTHLLYSGDLVSRRLQGSPQGRVPGPRLLLQDLLLNGVQVLHHVPGEALLGSDEHLDHLEGTAKHRVLD